MFKDETHAKPIVEFVGLRAKSYSLLVLQDDIDKMEKRVAKGVPRVAIQNRLTHADYKCCLLSSVSRDRQTYTAAQIIRSENHRLYTREIVKQSLSPYDDKRYVLQDERTTLAYGHYRIHETQEERAVHLSLIHI